MESNTIKFNQLNMFYRVENFGPWSSLGEWWIVKCENVFGINDIMSEVVLLSDFSIMADV